MTTTRTATRLAAALALSFLAACGHARKPSEIVWPLPPQKPRIRFVDSFRSGLDLDRSGWARFRRAVFGGSNQTSFVQPLAIAVSEDGKRVYVADSMRGAVLRADLESKRLEPFAPKALVATAAGVALDGDENVYITDPKKREIVVVTKEGERLRQIGTGDLVRPLGLAVDWPRRLLYVVDTGNQKGEGHRVLVYALDGRFLRELRPDHDPPGRGDLEGQFHFPTYVAVGPGGEVFVADTLNFRIQVFSPEGKYLRTGGRQGNGPGTFSRLKGLAFDGFGNLYAADADHASVQIFNRSFDLLLYFGGPGPFVEVMDLPGAIAIHPATNRIYVCMEGTPRVNVYELFNTTAGDSVPLPVPPPPAGGAAKADGADAGR